MRVDDGSTFRQQMDRVEALIEALERIADPTAQATARELVQVLLGLHGAALERMLDLTYEGAGQAVVDRLGEDAQVGGLLLLHGLHPLPLATRVQQALDTVRPYLATHDGGVALLGVTPEGTVHLRLEGTCHGCPSSRATLHYAVEEAIYKAAPDVVALEVEGVEDAAPTPALDGFIPLTCPTDLSV